MSRTMSLALAALLAYCATAQARNIQPPLADRIPGDAVFYVGWAGQNKALAESRFGRLLVTFIKPLGEWLQEARGGRPATKADQPPVTDKDALAELQLLLGMKFWDRPMAAAIMGLDRKDEDFGMRWLWLIDAGDRKNELVELLAMWTAKNKDVLDLQQVMQDGIAIDTFSISGARRGGIAWIGNTLLICPDAGRLRQWVRPEAVLARSADFLKHMGQLEGPDTQVWFYLDNRSLIRRLAVAAEHGEAMEVDQDQHEDEHAQKSRETFKQFLDRTHIDRLEAVAGAIRFVDDMTYTKVRFIVPAPRVGVWQLFAGPAITPADFGSVRADSQYVGIWRLAATQMYTLLSGRAEQDNLIEKTMRDDLGVSLREDVLAHLGDRWILSSSPHRGGLLTGLMLDVPITNKVGLDATMAKMQAFLAKQSPNGKGDTGLLSSFFQEGPYSVRKIDDADTTIHYLLRKAGLFNPVAPSWCLKDGRLLAAFFPQVLAGELDDTPPVSLVDNPQFAKFRAKVSKTPCFLGYVDLPQVVSGYYPTVLVLLTVMLNHSPESPLLLPPLPRFHKLLTPQISAISADAQAIVFEEYGALPLGGIGSMPFGSPLGAALSEFSELFDVARLGVPLP